MGFVGDSIEGTGDPPPAANRAAFQAADHPAEEVGTRDLRQDSTLLPERRGGLFLRDGWRVEVVETDRPSGIPIECVEPGRRDHIRPADSESSFLPLKYGVRAEGGLVVVLYG